MVGWRRVKAKTRAMKQTQADTPAAAGMTRRSFLKQSLGAGGLLLAPTLLPGTVWGAEVGPNDRVGVALLGHGLMGAGHLQRLAYDPAFQLVAVCDVDAVRREAGRTKVNEIYAATRPGARPEGCAAYADYREVLARKDVDAVVIVTPDHWHAWQSIHAAQAGKDIYCEKPISVTLDEGRRVAQAVKRYGRVFQTGTQYRSIPAIRKVCRFIREGRLGKVRQVFALYGSMTAALNAKRCQPYAAVFDLARCGEQYAPLDFALPPEPVPEGLDWDMWVGPAPWRPYNRLYHENPSPGVVPWAFSDAFGATASTWYLSHAADVIQWALGCEYSGPVEILHPGSGGCPTLTLRYAQGTLLHLVDSWKAVKEVYHAVPENARLEGNFGGLFVGERGWLTTMSVGGRLEGEPESLFDEMELKRTPEVNIGSNTHHANWLECLRSRQKPAADEEIGHRSASIGHLANIASRLGRSLKWDPVRETFDDPLANRLRSRATRQPWA